MVGFSVIPAFIFQIKSPLPIFWNGHLSPSFLIAVIATLTTDDAGVAPRFVRRPSSMIPDLEDLHREAGTVAVLGKGRTEKTKLTLPPETKKALEAWINVRGDAPGPLFCSMNRTKPGVGRLTAIGLYGVVRELGRKIGLYGPTVCAMRLSRKPWT
jgi:hypothetical protein